MKYFYGILSLLGIFLFCLFMHVSPVSAAEVRATKTVYIPKEAMIDGSLFTAGSAITIDANIDGDIYCAGQTVMINGDVNGDILCAAQSLTVNGHVNGNVRTAAQSFDLNGIVERNMSSLGQKIDVKPAASVNGELFLASQQAVVEGTIQKDMSGALETMDLRGHIGKNVNLEVENLTVHDGASIAGNLTYTSSHKAQLQPGLVAGTVRQHEPKRPVRREKSQEERTVGWVIGKIISILSFSLLGLMLAYFWPKQTKTLYKNMTTNARKYILQGAIIMFITPILAVIIAITVIGLPLSLLMLFVWIAALIVSRVLVGIVVGEYILRQYGTKYKENIWLITLIGMTVITIGFALPFVGWLLSVVSFWWGTGQVLQYIMPNNKSG